MADPVTGNLTVLIAIGDDAHRSLADTGFTVTMTGTVHTPHITSGILRVNVGKVGRINNPIGSSAAELLIYDSPVSSRYSWGNAKFSADLVDWEFTEDVTALDLNSPSVGVIGFQCSVPDWPSSNMITGMTCVIKMGKSRVFKGIIDSVDTQGSNVNITALSMLSRLDYVARVAPTSGSIAGIMNVVFNKLGGITISVDPSVAARKANLPGFNDNVWKKLQEFLTAHQLEIADNGSQIIVRPTRQRKIRFSNISGIDWSTDRSQLAQQYQITNYNSQWSTRFALHTNLYDVITINPGELYQATVDVDGSIASVEQPAAVNSVSLSDGSKSVYCVIAQGANPENTAIYDAAWWNSHGGFVHVEPSDDYSQLVVTASSGTNTGSVGPWVVAIPDGYGGYLSSLRLFGKGLKYNQDDMVFVSGATSEMVSDDSVKSVDSVFVDNQDYASKCATEMSFKFGSPTVTLKATLHNVDQLPGNIAGSRFQYLNSMWRITEAVSKPDGVQVTAEQDTLFSDFMGAFTDVTIGQFDPLDRTYTEFAAQPLKPLS